MDDDEVTSDNAELSCDSQDEDEDKKESETEKD